MAREKVPPRGYSEQELRDRGIGKYIEARMYGWDTKERTYREEKVKAAYVKLKSSFRPLVTDETGYVFHDLASKIAQKQIDTFLLRRSRGDDVVIPQPVAPKRVVEAEGKKADGFLVNMGDFGESADAEMDPVRDLTWIYNHVAVRDVEPCDAPSPGAYAHLKFIQQSADNMVDFFTKVYPRIIPSKSQIESLNKFNDDGRANFDILERLQGESEDGKE